MDGLEDQKPVENDFIKKLDENISNENLKQPAEEGKPKRGRPKKVVLPPPPPQPIPPRVENKEFALLIKGMANSFIKEEKIWLTDEEALRLSAPYFQLYIYYIPFANGIGSVWIDALICTAGICIAKYQIAKEIMKNEPRKENNFDNGNKGDGEVHKSEGVVVEGTITGTSL